MKKTFTVFALLLAGVCTAQTITETFETFTLQPASYYKDTTSQPFQTDAAVFSYEWTGGMYPFWSGGFSYTNRYDSVTAGFTNLYGVKPYKGFNGSSIYLVGQDKGIVRMRYPQTVVEGFYYTNSTYAFKSMQNGDAFARKFGDTTGTGSGTTIAQGDYPDFFKMVVRGYLNGQLKADSIEIYLADFRFSSKAQDYIVADWRYASTSNLGVVDSIRFDMRSSDMGQWGMNTPAFFGIDNFVTSNALLAGLTERDMSMIQVYPQPCHEQLVISHPSAFSYRLLGADLRLMEEGQSEGRAELQMQSCPSGIYFLRLQTDAEIRTIRIIRQ